MTALHDTVAGHLTAPGAVALLARGDDVEIATVGAVDVDGSAPMRRDTLFRIASVTKPITAAALSALIDDGLAALDDPIARWLPELADPVVVRRPDGPAEEVVPAPRPITVEHVLASTAGWGFPADFTLPAVQPLSERLRQGPPQTPVPLDPDAWLRTLADIPLPAPPGERWLYNLCSDLQGVLVARISGRSLPDFLTERIFTPLGMVDTGFVVPGDRMHRFTDYYAQSTDGPTLVDARDGIWSREPVFPSGAAGLVSTVEDWCAFGRMLLRGGRNHEGRRVLSTDAVRRMTTNRLTPAQRDAGRLFLEGQGWGFGGSVDIDTADPWTVPGRYGWIGGTGTSAHIDPSRGTVAVLFTQLEMDSPSAPAVMREFWTYARLAKCSPSGFSNGTVTRQVTGAALTTLMEATHQESAPGVRIPAP
ncbi:serine hydrolase domain-containing protein [Nakamurella deserti]|uniref:serine hydrolase domain-containing protein n=1 Tax=Nakamurella deserti TaxID=2164074 RepID=UPI000DBE7F01|nr:serine hydrolase domain-containing protein [Nakamurella deserti]